MKARIIVGIVGVLLLGTSLTTYLFFRSDITNAYRRLDAIETSRLELPGGSAEYRIHGEGPAVLIVHGNSGGHDQAMQTGRDFFGDDYRIVAVSRFGYLGSDLPADSSPRAQAEVYREILAREGIERVVVMGVSAGGAPSIRFALDHPELTRALVLVAADVPSKEPAEATGPPHALLNDFPFWLVTHPLRRVMFGMFGLGNDAYRDGSPEARASVDRMFETLLPMRPRRDGVVNDENVTNLDMSRNYDNYPLESLEPPALVFQAKDDPLASYEKVARAAERIPDCTFVAFEDGGHLLFGHGDEIDAALATFMERLGRRPRP
jgi:pimeloyl-ACP methyl ester carboxylesterase